MFGRKKKDFPEKEIKFVNEKKTDEEVLNDIRERISPPEPPLEPSGFIPRLDMDWIWFNQKAIADERIDKMHIIYNRCQDMASMDVFEKRNMMVPTGFEWPKQKTGYIHMAMNSEVNPNGFNYIQPAAK